MKQNPYGLSDEQFKKIQRTKELGTQAGILLEKHRKQLLARREAALKFLRKIRNMEQ